MQRQRSEKLIKSATGFARSAPRLGFVVLFAALAACVETTPVEVKPLTPAMKEEVFALAMAVNILDNCPSRFGPRMDAMEATVSRMSSESAGLSIRQMNSQTVDRILHASFSDREAQDRAIAYIQKRGIVVADKRTWCTAGAAEVRSGSRISKYLSGIIPTKK